MNKFRILNSAKWMSGLGLIFFSASCSFYGAQISKVDRAFENQFESLDHELKNLDSSYHREILDVENDIQKLQSEFDRLDQKIRESLDRESKLFWENLNAGRENKGPILDKEQERKMNALWQEFLKALNSFKMANIGRVETQKNEITNVFEAEEGTIESRKKILSEIHARYSEAAEKLKDGYGSDFQEDNMEILKKVERLLSQGQYQDILGLLTFLEQNVGEFAPPENIN